MQVAPLQRSWTLTGVLSTCSLNFQPGVFLKGPETGIVALAGDIPDSVLTSISAFYKLALELVQSLRGLSKEQTVLDFMDTSSANQRALICRKRHRR